MPVTESSVTDSRSTSVETRYQIVQGRGIFVNGTMGYDSIEGGYGVISTVQATKEIMDELKVALKGEGKETGLIAEIKSLNEFNTKVRERDVWLARLVAGSVITGAIAYVLSLLLK